MLTLLKTLFMVRQTVQTGAEIFDTATKLFTDAQVNSEQAIERLEGEVQELEEELDAVINQHVEAEREMRERHDEITREIADKLSEIESKKTKAKKFKQNIDSVLSWEE